MTARGMTTDQRRDLRVALLQLGLNRIGYTQDDGTGVYDETWEKDGATVTISWATKRLEAAS